MSFAESTGMREKLGGKWRSQGRISKFFALVIAPNKAARLVGMPRRSAPDIGGTLLPVVCGDGFNLACLGVQLEGLAWALTLFGVEINAQAFETCVSYV